VYNFYNLPNVENFAIGCSQVKFVEQALHLKILI